MLCTFTEDVLDLRLVLESALLLISLGISIPRSVTELR